MAINKCNNCSCIGSLSLSTYYVSNAMCVVLFNPQKNTKVSNMVLNCVDSETEVQSNYIPCPRAHLLQSWRWELGPCLISELRTL